MKIRMVAHRTGPRYDDRAWPGPGGEIDVPDEEGAGLCAQGDAVPVARPDADVETREAAESPAEAPEPSAEGRPPPQNAPKAAWVAWAARAGAAAADLEQMPKAELIARYGG